MFEEFHYDIYFLCGFIKLNKKKDDHSSSIVREIHNSDKNSILKNHREKKSLLDEFQSKLEYDKIKS